MADIYASGNNEVVTGTEEDDNITATNTSQESFNNLTIDGNGGDDQIDAAQTSFSTIYGDAGDDTLHAASSYKTEFYGGEGNDILHADNSDEGTFYGGSGHNIFYGDNAQGNISAYGEGEDDAFYAGTGSGTFSFYGGDGGNAFFAGGAPDTPTSVYAYGGGDGDAFYGGSHQGTLEFYGGGGDDAFFARTANDMVADGGEGEDVVAFDSLLGAYAISFDTSTHSVTLTIEGQQSVTAMDVETFYFKNSIGRYEEHTYDQLASAAHGTSNYFASYSGETIEGSTGADNINATYSSSINFSNLTLHGNGGNDEVWAAGTSSSTVYGDAGGDVLHAEQSQNTVFYGGDDDDTFYAEESTGATFYGDGGNNAFFGGSVSGTVNFFGGDGIDYFSGDSATGDLNFYGGEGGNNFLAGVGGDGASTLSAYGGTGGDTFYGGSYQGTLTFSGGAGDDSFYAEYANKINVDAGEGIDSVIFEHDLSSYAVDAYPSGHVMTFYANGHQDVTTIDVEFFYFRNSEGGYDKYTYDELACFLQGTLIRTPDGEVPVETLKAGDLVLTTTGEARPVLWLGRRAVETRLAHPLTALPIHIRPDALGRGLPARDLFVSPDHAFFIGGMLIQAAALVNGVTITRHHDLPEIFTYYHVELQDHDLIYAEGLPAETFIDNLERETFDNAADFPGRSRPAVELDLPRVKSRRQLPKVLARALGERAARAVPRVA